jgi:hypothetical protein
MQKALRSQMAAPKWQAKRADKAGKANSKPKHTAKLAKWFANSGKPRHLWA